jgi:hypothetical protein
MGSVADEFLALSVVTERRFRKRTDEDFEQPGVHGARGSGRFVHGGSFLLRHGDDEIGRLPNASKRKHAFRAKARSAQFMANAAFALPFTSADFLDPQHRDECLSQGSQAYGASSFAHLRRIECSSVPGK